MSKPSFPVYYGNETTGIGCAVDGARAISTHGDAPDPSADVETVDNVEDRRRAIRFERDFENLRLED
jgi:hypothetical protein